MKRVFLLLLAALTAGAALPAASLERNEPVDFTGEVLPFLRDNCLSCHSKSRTKGGLNMETPELMLKGGETGPGLVPGKAAESLVFKAATHELEDVKMPPRDNKAKAKDLTPQMLGVLKLWINQGAKPSSRTEQSVQWQPLPEKLGAILTTAITADGQFAACSRASRISIYQLATGRTLRNEIAHRDQVNALAFSPDGMLLASGGYREVKLWRRTSSGPKLALADAGTKLTVSPDGKWLATGGENGVVKLWGLPGGKPGPVIVAASSPLRALCFSPDNTILACLAAGNSLSLWSVPDGTSLAAAGLPSSTGALAWVGNRLATGGSDGIIRLWKGLLVPEKEWAAHSGALTALHAQGSQLLSGGADGSVRLWNVEKGEATVQMAHGGPVTAVAIRPDGKRFASAGSNKLARLWDASGKPVAELKGDRRLIEAAEECDRNLQIATRTAAFQKEGIKNAETQLAAGKEQTKKNVAELPSKQQEVEAKQKALADARLAKAAVDQALVLSEAELKKAEEALQGAQTVAQQSKADPALQEAAKAERDQRATARKQAADKIASALKALTDAEQSALQAEAARRQAVSEIQTAIKDEEKLTAAIPEVIAALDTAELIRKAAEDTLLAARQKASQAELPVQALAFSPDNQTLVTASDDKRVCQWSAETGAAMEVLSGLNAIAFTSEGELAAIRGDGSAVILDLSVEWKLERSIGSEEGPSPFTDRICALAFSNDGKLLATGGGEPSRGGEIKLWKAESGELVRDLPDIHSDAVLSLEFSRDDLQLLSGAADRMARVVEVASGKLTRTLEGHSHHVLGVSWSPDSRTIATAGADNTLKIWDAATGDRKTSIEGCEKEVTTVRFVGIGDKLLTSSGDNKVRFLSPDGAQLLAFNDAPAFVNAAAVSANGKVVIAGGYDGVLRVWQGSDGKVLATFAPRGGMERRRE